jgi:hypothetical protein
MKRMAMMLARIYSKKMKKGVKDVQKMMDEETFFFGKEAVEIGLADGIVKGSNVQNYFAELNNKDDAIAYAQLEIEECINTIKSSGKKEDINKIAALFGMDTIALTKKIKADIPAEAGENNNIKGVNIMTLDQLLAENPAAKDEYEKRLEVKFNAGIDAGRKEVSKRVEKAAPFIKADYPDKVKALAAEVVLGDKSLETLEAVVAVMDMGIETMKSAAAQTEQPDETPAEQPTPMTETGIAQNVADIKSLVAMDNGGV